MKILFLCKFSFSFIKNCFNEQTVNLKLGNTLYIQRLDIKIKLNYQTSFFCCSFHSTLKFSDHKT